MRAAGAAAKRTIVARTAETPYSGAYPPSVDLVRSLLYSYAYSLKREVIAVPRVVLVLEDERKPTLLPHALEDAGYRVIACVKSGEDLSVELDALKPDLVVMEVESPDEAFLTQLQTLARDKPLPVVVFAQRSESRIIHEAVRAGVSAFIVDGLSAARVGPVIEVAIARFREYHALKQELHQTKSKLEERKLVERAKGILMNQREMSEENAYQALRKMAMDRNQKLADVARNLIDIAGLLA